MEQKETPRSPLDNAIFMIAKNRVLDSEKKTYTAEAIALRLKKFNSGMGGIGLIPRGGDQNAGGEILLRDEVLRSIYEDPCVSKNIYVLEQVAGLAKETKTDHQELSYSLKGLLADPSDSNSVGDVAWDRSVNQDNRVSMFFAPSGEVTRLEFYVEDGQDPTHGLRKGQLAIIASEIIRSKKKPLEVFVGVRIFSELVPESKIG